MEDLWSPDFLSQNQAGDRHPSSNGGAIPFTTIQGLSNYILETSLGQMANFSQVNHLWAYPVSSLNSQVFSRIVITF